MKYFGQVPHQASYKKNVTSRNTAILIRAQANLPEYAI